MPAEAEFFWMRKVDDKAEAEKAHQKDLRIWDKPTAASRNGATRTLRDDELPMAPIPPALQRALAQKGRFLELEKPDEHFLTTIATKPAVGVVEPLRNHDHNLRSYVEKKRESFLVQMSLDVKKAEIVRLDEKARMKEEALARSHQMLDEDTKKFEEFRQGLYAKAQKTAKDAEGFAKRKADKQQRIKNIKQQISSTQSEVSRLRESREESTRYKRFFEKLTPPEWRQQQEEAKKQRKAERRQSFIESRMAAVLERFTEEEKAIDKSAGEEPRDKKGRKKAREREEEEEQRERERQARRKKLERRKADEERRIAEQFNDASSEEEPELYFKEPRQLMDTFTELEERNLFLIQSSQETEQMLDDLEHNFEYSKKKMTTNVHQLNETIRNLQASIAAEQAQRAQLQRKLEEKAGTHVQDQKLEDLYQQVYNVYVKCGLLDEHTRPETLQMLGSIESQLEDLIHGMEEAYHLDAELVMRLEKQKLRERSERVRQQKIQETAEKQEERLKNSLLRSQAPVFKKAGKQVMYRSPPLRQEKKLVLSDDEHENNTRDHQVFGMYIDRASNMPRTEPPVHEDASRTQRAAPSSSAETQGGESSFAPGEASSSAARGGSG